MGKRTGENQDYYKHAGQSAGRRVLESERRKLAQEKAGEKQAAPAATPKVPPVKATPGAKQTLEYARKARETARRVQQEQAQRQVAERVAHDEVQRMVDAEVPLSAPPERQLPQATASTELSDLWRSVQDNARSVGQSVRTAREAGVTFYRSIAELLRTPIRLFRLVREASA
ncbi:MAG TPA: hypothetical protein VGK67_37810 [Myxococcales bacterium]|jgi:hypothetical protein